MREEIERVLINHGGLNLWDNKVRSSIVNALLEVVGGNKNTSKSNTNNIRNVSSIRPAEETTETPAADVINKIPNDKSNSSRDNLRKNKSNTRRDRPKSTNKKPAKPSSKKRVRKNKSVNMEELELMGKNIPTNNR